MKIYISIPTAGRNFGEAAARANKVKAVLERLGHSAVTPFDVCTDQSKPYSNLVGCDIEALLKCDAVCLCMDYYRSKGCCLEKEAARIYGKRIIYEYDLYGRNLEDVRRRLM